MREKEIIFLIEESMEGGYEVKALGHSIFTQGDTVEEVKTNIREAMQCHFASEELPSVVRLHWIREEVIPA